MRWFDASGFLSNRRTGQPPLRTFRTLGGEHTMDATQPPSLDPSVLAPRPRWLWLLALVPFLALVLHEWSWPPPPDAGDYAQYLLHALALLEGRPYAETGYIFHPAAWVVGPVTYPPGLPLTLVPLVAFGGVHSVLIRALMPCCIALFAALAYRRLTHSIPAWQAAIAIAMTALAIQESGDTRVPISDPGFCALLWGCILAADTTMHWTWRRILAVTVLGAGAIGYRMAGLALVPALALFALTTWRTLRGRPLIPVVLWLLGGLVVILLQPGAATSPGINSLSAIPNWIRFAAKLYKVAILEIELYPVSSNTLRDAYHLVASVCMLAGMTWLVWTMRRSLVVALGVSYVLMLVIVPVAEPRYLWPFFPVLAAGLVVGVTGAATVLLRVPRHSRADAWTRASMAAAVALVVVCGAALARSLTRPAPKSNLATPQARDLFDWLRAQNASAPVRVVYGNPRVIVLEAGVSAMGNVARSPAGHLAAYRDVRITHLIVDATGGGDCTQRIANHLPIQYPSAFHLAFENAAFRVYAVDLQAGGSEPFSSINYGRIERWCAEHPDEVSHRRS